jgi:hypothetical protein
MPLVFPPTKIFVLQLSKTSSLSLEQFGLDPLDPRTLFDFQ